MCAAFGPLLPHLRFSSQLVERRYTPDKSLMIRTRLTVLILGLLIGTLLFSGILIWSTDRTHHYLERSKAAHDVLVAYLALSEAAYRHFKELGDSVVDNQAASVADLAEGPKRLRARLAEIRRLTEREVAVVDEDERAEEQAELQSIAELSRTLDRVLSRHEAIRQRLRDKRDPTGWAALFRLTEQEIDGTFRRQIETAIEDETLEASAAHEEARILLNQLEWIDVGATFLAIGIALAALFFLSTRILAPLNELVTGVQRLSEGDLEHRIRLPGNDEFARLGSVLNDMAARLHRQRKKLLESRIDLERTVKERTEDLARANAELNRINALRRRFLADISHELRTPITVIRGEADVALHGKAKSAEVYHDALMRIVDQTMRLGRLVDDLLLVARVRDGALQLNLCPVPLYPLLSEACAAASAMREGSVETEIANDDTQIAVLGDRERLMQLFMIILDNALRYSEENTKISVRITSAAGQALVTISDNGVGMQPEDVENAFDRYYRGESGRTMSPNGSGLGLPVAKAIVDAHHGDIGIESSPGSGTSLSVRLPMAEA